MCNNDLLILLAISDMRFLSLREKIILKEKLDNITDLALLSKEDISLLLHRPLRTKNWCGSEAVKKAKYSAQLIEKYDILYCVYGSPLYPPLLLEIYDPPYLLFVRGNHQVLCDTECIAVVGTRRPTVNGMRAASEFASAAVRDGKIIVSGLAYGIDAAAHCGTIAAGGHGVGVLACGLDSVYPVANRRLAQKMIELGGCLVSEYSPGTVAQKWHFIQRNRIIAGLSKSVLVVEAPPGSGALSTADFALEQGRDVFFHHSAVRKNAYRDVEMTDVQMRRNMLKTVEQYVSEGAQLVSSYEEYCQLDGSYITDRQLLL